MRKFLLSAAAIAAAALATPALAGTVIYDTPPTTGPNQNWTGVLGLDFVVTSRPVTIDGLGAFDGDKNGINSDIWVGIFNGDGSVAVAAVNFNGSAATGQDFIFKAINGVTLAPGNYQLAAWGYGNGEGNYNAYGPSGSAITFNSLFGSLAATGTRYGNAGSAGVLATNVDNGLTRYGSASFTASVPESATWAMMLLGFGMIGGAARSRRKAKIAFA
jgi:hypothetical protein